MKDMYTQHGTYDPDKNVYVLPLQMDLRGLWTKYNDCMKDDDMKCSFEYFSLVYQQDLSTQVQFKIEEMSARFNYSGITLDAERSQLHTVYTWEDCLATFFPKGGTEYTWEACLDTFFPLEHLPECILCLAEIVGGEADRIECSDLGCECIEKDMHLDCLGWLVYTAKTGDGLVHCPCCRSLWFDMLAGPFPAEMS